MTHPYLAQVIQQTQPSDNDLRVGTVAANDGGAVRVNVNDGLVDCGFLRSYVPNVGDTVAILRQESGWLVLGSIEGPASPAGEDPATPSGGIVGEAYFSGGTAVLAAGGAENIMTAWTAGGTFTFDAGQLYRWNFAFGFYESANTNHLVEIRLRKGFSTGGLQLAQFRRTLTPVGASIVQMGEHSGYIKNATGGGVSTAVGASIQRSAGTGNVGLYGDATFQMILTLEHLGATTNYPTLSAIAVEIN